MNSTEIDIFLGIRQPLKEKGLPKKKKDVVVVKEKLPEVINSKRLIRWVDGAPVPTNVPLVYSNPDNFQKLLPAFLSLDFGEFCDGTEEEKREKLIEHYKDMTHGEVLMFRLVQDAVNGDALARTKVLEYMLGKPKQQVESKTLSMTYQDFLEHEANKRDIILTSPEGEDDGVTDVGTEECA